MKESIGTKIKKMRKEENLTQEELADLMKMTRANISLLESDKINITHENIIKICNIFNIESDTLLNIKIDTE